MRCEHVQRLVSAGMDDPVARPLPEDVQAHASSCPACRAFVEGSWRIRKVSRLEVAPPVRDLAPAVMERIAAEQARGSRVRRVLVPTAGRLLPGRGRLGPVRPLRRAIALGVAAGLVAGFVLTGGGIVFRRTPGTGALAAEIPRRLVAAAQGLRGYRATFDVVERHWAAAVPRRTFVARVAFRAPEDFLVRVRDTSSYPPGDWTRNDLALSTNGRAWVAVGPEPCPEGVPAPCPGGAPVLQRVVHRPPFDQSTPMPTDVIVPMTVLAAADRVQVLGPGEVGGRPAVAVGLTYQDATPLFAYLHFLGSWRPFFPQDRVVVWLDRATWFPLSYQVYPASGEERARWAGQAGVGPERPGRAVFSATIRSLRTAAPPRTEFSPRRVPRGSVVGRPSVLDEGFVELSLADLGSREAPPRPAWTSGLRPVRYGELPRTEARPFLETVAAYSHGLAWATVARVTGWAEGRAFGVGPFAQQMQLSGGRPALYEPATSSDARRLFIHTRDGEILVSTNLPLSALTRLASSLPVRPLPEPRSWRVHRWSGGVVEDGLSPQAALRRASFRVLVPAWLPAGYGPAAAQIVRTERIQGVTLVYRRPAAELDGLGIQLYQAAGQSFPPPTSTDEQMVGVAGEPGRWSPSDHELEWVSHGVYRSLTGPALQLATLLKVATSLRPGAGP